MVADGDTPLPPSSSPTIPLMNLVLSILRAMPSRGIAVLLFAIGILPPTVARGVVTMEFIATDLTDVTLGQDLWRYSYQPGGFAFGAGQGFTVFFDWTLFTSLESPPPVVNVEWDAISVQPDPGLNSDGFYDALALTSNPSLADPFRLEFIWLGPGTPGAQPFTIYDTNFSTIAQGQTTPVIPEPRMGVLLFLGLTAVSMRRRLLARFH